MKRMVRPTLVLLGAVAVNYTAQIPYYLHQYYFPHHQTPSVVGTLLLGLTLSWFIVGYSRYVLEKRDGWGILLGFLLAQVLFYSHSVVLGLLTGGGVEAQLTTKSHFLLVIFSIGYVNFLVSSYYVFWLLRHRRPANIA